MLPKHDTITALLVGLITGAIVAFTVIESEFSELVLNANQRIVTYFQEVEGLPNNFTKKIWGSHNTALKSSVRVLCWVMTHPKNHLAKAKYIRYSWGKHCNHLIFISEGNSEAELPVVKVDAPSGRTDLWKKVRNAFLHIHKTFNGQYDWVMKADDDTFVNVNSLRGFLLGHNPDEPLFFGEQLRSHYGQHYVAGGGGYVLSREGVNRLVNLLNDKRPDNQVGCNREKATSEEDPSISSCLIQAKVKATDSRDRLGLNRFSQHAGIDRNPSWNSEKDWYWKYQLYQSTRTKMSVGCCSGSAISFHYIEPTRQFELEFLMHLVNPEDASLTLATNKIENFVEEPNFNI